MSLAQGLRMLAIVACIAGLVIGLLQPDWSPLCTGLAICVCLYVMKKSGLLAVGNVTLPFLFASFAVVLAFLTGMRLGLNMRTYYASVNDPITDWSVKFVSTAVLALLLGIMVGPWRRIRQEQLTVLARPNRQQTILWIVCGFVPIVLNAVTYWYYFEGLSYQNQHKLGLTALRYFIHTSVITQASILLLFSVFRRLSRAEQILTGALVGVYLAIHVGLFQMRSHLSSSACMGCISLPIS